MAPQVSWIGLGNMGRGMVKNICEKASLDKPILLYNRTTQRSSDLRDKVGDSKASVVTSIPEAVGPADIIFTCVGDDAAIMSTIDAALSSSSSSGSGSVSVSGKLFVDCSTVHPDTTSSLKQKLEAAGAHFVACPVFGAPAAAEAGALVCVLAGPTEQVARVRPFCKGVMGRAEIDFSGQEPSKALLLKLIGNTFVLQMVEALAVGHTLAEKSGLGTDNLHAFVETMFPGPYAAYSNRMLSGDYYTRDEPLFGVDLARKDARHALDLAQRGGARAKAVELADQHLKVVKEERGEKGDIAGIYGAVRKEAGLEFGNQK